MGISEHLTPENLLKVFQKNLEIQRVKQSLSQRELAKGLNKGGSTIAQWELGNSYPTLETFLQLCLHLGVTPNDLFSIEVENPPPKNGKHHKMLKNGIVSGGNESLNTIHDVEESVLNETDVGGGDYNKESPQIYDDDVGFTKDEVQKLKKLLGAMTT